MLIKIPYDRKKAVAYAKEWALRRNPKFLSFDGMGGDCTNFASQCVYAGCGVMNYTPNLGWYYKNASDRAAAWSGVEFLYNFLISNKKAGPYAIETGISQAEEGDLVQLGDTGGHFYHTPVVIQTGKKGIYVAAHTFDAFMRPLDSYSYSKVRCLHILGARRYQ